MVGDSDFLPCQNGSFYAILGVIFGLQPRSNSLNTLSMHTVIDRCRDMGSLAVDSST